MSSLVPVTPNSTILQDNCGCDGGLFADLVEIPGAPEPIALGSPIVSVPPSLQVSRSLALEAGLTPIADWVMEPGNELESGIASGLPIATALEFLTSPAASPATSPAANDDSLLGAIDLGLLTDGQVSRTDRLDGTDRLDYYRLSLNHASRLSLGLEPIAASGAGSASPTFQLLDAQGQAIDPTHIKPRGNSRDVDLARGDYYLKITSPANGPTAALDYRLKASATAIAEWSMLVYMAADNNLEAYGIQDFLEMAAVGSNRDVTIAVTFDRAAGHSTAYGDWTTTKRGIVQAGDRPTATWGQDLGERNMGSSRTLAEFLTWGRDAAPALRYQLVLWNHGGGWNRIATDDGNQGDYLTATELTTALTPSPKLDIIGADACYMGMVEFAYQLRSEADYFVGSAAAEQAEGWDYSHLLQQLNANPQADSQTVAQSIVSSYGRQPSNSLSAIDLDEMDALRQALDVLVDQLITPPEPTSPTSPTAINALKSSRTKSLSFGPETLGFRDLGQLLQGLANTTTLTTAQRSAAKSALAAYRKTILANVSHRNGTGLSIYLPGVGTSIDNRYSAANQQFAANGRWDDLLQWWWVNSRNPSTSGKSPLPTIGGPRTIAIRDDQDAAIEAAWDLEVEA
jgi:hypothetical protein